MEHLSLAIRNVRRNERRSKLTIITIVIGVTILMNYQGLIRGFTVPVYGRMMSMDTAQVQVEAAGYRGDARRLPLDLVVEDPDGLEAELRRLPGVRAVSQRVDALFEVTNGTDGVRAMARGVSQSETEVTELGARLVEGRMFAEGEPGLVMGAGLAGKLGLHAGDVAWFTALDRRSARNLGSATVVGVFKYDYPFFDDNVVFLDLGQARSFLDLGPVSTRLVVRGDDPQASAALARRVGEAVEVWSRAAAADAAREGKAAPAAPVAYDWKAFAEGLVSTVETRVRLLYSILGVLFCLIIAGIFNTMAMNVQERQREIGTLRAIGIRRSGLQRVFIAEGLVLGLMGCVVAVIPSTIVGLWLGVWGIDLTGIFPRDIPIPFGTVMRSVYSVSDAFRALAAGLGAALLGSWLPARAASRLPITEALASVR